MEIFKTLYRVYVNDIDEAICFYQKLFDSKCGSIFKYDKAGLTIAQIGGILIIGGAESALEPFKNTNITILVDSVSEYKAFLLQNGAEIMSDIKEVPTGFNMTIRHKEGTIVEYVEHNSEIKEK